MSGRSRLFAAFFYGAILAACVSQIVPPKKYADGWIGRPLDEYKAVRAKLRASQYTYEGEINWKEKTYGIDEEHYAYIAPIRSGCFIHWRIDKRGDRIVGYTFEGDRCW